MGSGLEREHKETYGTLLSGALSRGQETAPQFLTQWKTGPPRVNLWWQNV